MARKIPAIFKFRPKVHRNETETKLKPGKSLNGGKYKKGNLTETVNVKKGNKTET